MKSWRDLSHELFPDSVFQKLLRINFDDAHQRRLHGQQALREDGDVVGQLGNLAIAFKYEYQQQVWNSEHIKNKTIRIWSSI